MPTISPRSSRGLAARLGLWAVAVFFGAALWAAPVCAARAEDGHVHQEPARPAPAAHDAHGEHGAPAGQGGHADGAHAGHPAAADDQFTPAPDLPAHDHEAMQALAEERKTPVGVDEHLGGYVPLDTVFTDSQGREVALGEVMGAPTLILPVFYTCPNVCNILQGAMARVLPKVSLTPGQDLKIVSLSFDERDTPEAAARNKRNFAAALGQGFPPEHWAFLTGSRESIATTMDALGFRFQRMGDDFAHPVVVVAVAPDGKIVRYLYGSDFLPFDVTMAATEAAKGTPGLSVKRILSYCYSYDPKGRRYAFDILRVTGFTVLGTIALLLVVLLAAGKRKRR